MEKEAMTIERRSKGTHTKETDATPVENLASMGEHVWDAFQGAVTATGDTVGNITEAVGDTMEHIKEATGEAVESVQSAVSDTIQAVKGTFDLPYQVRQHPWLMVGASIVLGFVVGNFARRR